MNAVLHAIEPVVAHGETLAVARPSSATVGLARCTASDMLKWSGMSAEICTQTDRLVFSTRRIKANTVLVREGSQFGTLYIVGSGSFKCSQSDLEGYEQVLGFALQGDVIGLDGLCEDRQSNTAIALEDSTVAVVPFRDFVRASHELPALERLLHLSVSRELRRKSVAQHVMAAASADVRLVRFLLEITGRHASLGFSGRRLRLRMSRRDIGSYLGVAHETVSRSLKGLAEAGYIDVNHKELEILDRDGLQRLQRNTRGVAERACPARKGLRAASQAMAPIAGLAGRAGVSGLADLSSFDALAA